MDDFRATSLDDLLRDRVRAVRAFAGPKAIPDDLLGALLDELASAVGRSDARSAPRDVAKTFAIRERAAAIAAVGDRLSELVSSGALAATPDEIRAVGTWVGAGLLACVDSLEAERTQFAAREAALRSVFATAEILIVEFDVDLRVRWTHDLDRQPFTDGARIGRSIEDLVASDDAGELGATLRRVIATGLPERTEVSIRPIITIPPLEEGPYDFLLAVEPTRDASGAIVGAICASTNITELKRTQLALGEAIGVRDLMMAVLAHDLRNPLTTVRALSSTFARNQELPEKVRQGLAHVQSASTRMDELIGTLLDFSAARAGRSIPVVRARTDLHTVTLAVLEELRQAAPERRLTLDSNGDTSADVDAARIAQVVSNLLGNALVHGAPDEPVQVVLDGSGGEAVLLSVRNQGAPIPRDLLPVLFEPFRRGVRAGVHPRGLGLGLYITREILRAHEGTVEVESTDDRGTIFAVRLPRAASNAPDGSMRESFAGRGQTPTHALRTFPFDRNPIASPSPSRVSGYIE